MIFRAICNRSESPVPALNVEMCVAQHLSLSALALNRFAIGALVAGVALSRVVCTICVVQAALFFIQNRRPDRARILCHSCDFRLVLNAGCVGCLL
jgi:hypothetical protein